MILRSQKIVALQEDLRYMRTFVLHQCVRGIIERMGRRQAEIMDYVWRLFSLSRSPRIVLLSKGLANGSSAVKLSTANQK